MQIYAARTRRGKAEVMRSRTLRGPLLVSVALVLAACGAETADPVASDPLTTTTIPTTIPTTTTAPPTTSAPATTSEPTTTERPASTSSTTVPTEPGPECRRLDDFDLDAGAWVIVNDGVMGGRSDGRGTIEDSTLQFFGTVVTAGGGFTSVRLRLDGTELDSTDFIRARLRLDDRTYGFTFEDDQAIQGRRISHGADLSPPSEIDPDGFAIVEVGYDELRPSVFGQEVPADAFDPDAAREIGIIIADGIDGEFQLDVDWIDACA